jgi:hypothetical protein
MVRSLRLLVCLLALLFAAPALAETTQEVVNKAPTGLALSPQR